MKKYWCVLLCLAAYPGMAQLKLQGSGLTLKSGTVFSIDSMVLIPFGDLTLANNTITYTSTPVRSMSGGGSIRQVHTFATPIVFTGTLGIKYSSGTLNGNTEASQQIAYGSQSAGGSYVTTTGSTRGTAGTYYVSNNLTGATIGQITTTNTGVALPVNIASLNVQPLSNCRVRISWEITGANDEAVAIEASGDGRLWQEVDGVPTTNNGPAFEVVVPALYRGNSYYRLKLTSQSGTISYSQTSMINDPCLEKQLLAVSPNPSREEVLVTINGGNNAPVFLQLTDATGKRLQTIRTTGPSYLLDLRSLPAGHYFLMVQDGIGAAAVQFQHIE